MGKLIVGITVACCLFSMAGRAPAQTRKAGLWELTTTQTFQQSPFPAGSSPSGGPHTAQICLTEAQIERYGAIVPQIKGCQVTNVVKKPGGMTASMTCSGPISGSGTLESSWTDDTHATGSIHFVGTVGAGANVKPLEWTTATSAVFKGSECPNVQPTHVVPDK